MIDQNYKHSKWLSILDKLSIDLCPLSLASTFTSFLAMSIED